MTALPFEVRVKDMEDTYDYDDIDTAYEDDIDYADYDVVYEDFGGFEDYEPSPYDGTYSEE